MPLLWQRRLINPVARTLIYFFPGRIIIQLPDTIMLTPNGI